MGVDELSKAQRRTDASKEGEKAMPSRDGFLVVMSVRQWRDFCREHDRLRRRVAFLERQLEEAPTEMRGVNVEEWR